MLREIIEFNTNNNTFKVKKSALNIEDLLNFDTLIGRKGIYYKNSASVSSSELASFSGVLKINAQC